MCVCRPVSTAPWKSAFTSFCCTNCGLLQRQTGLVDVLNLNVVISAETKRHKQEHFIIIIIICTVSQVSLDNIFTHLPCWFQATTQVSDVLSPELMQGEEKLVSVR